MAFLALMSKSRVRRELLHARRAYEADRARKNAMLEEQIERQVDMHAALKADYTRKEAVLTANSAFEADELRAAVAASVAKVQEATAAVEELKHRAHTAEAALAQERKFLRKGLEEARDSRVRMTEEAVAAGEAAAKDATARIDLLTRRAHDAEEVLRRERASFTAQLEEARLAGKALEERMSELLIGKEQAEDTASRLLALQMDREEGGAGARMGEQPCSEPSSPLSSAAAAAAGAASAAAAAGAAAIRRTASPNGSLWPTSPWQ
jgi:hypothetical protein